jgi:NADH-quinone oxidoreductase subunit C
MDTPTTPESAPASVDTGTGSSFLDAIVKKITTGSGEPEAAFMGVDMPTIVVKPEGLVDACMLLRDDKDLRFKLLSDLTVVDYMEREPRFEVVYHLYSYQNNEYLRVKAGIPEEPCECPTVTTVWPGANWMEREAYDMYGVVFEGHPGLERILTPEGWEHFPLRRDFPVQGPGLIKLYDNVSDVF